MEESIETKSVKKSKTPLYISILIIASFILSYFFIPSVQDFLNNSWDVLTSDDEDRIKDWVGNFGWIGPIVLILTMVLQMFLLVIPSILLMVVSILAYGPIWGSLIIFASIFTASTIGYLIGRYFGPVIVEKLIGHKSERKIGEFLENYGFWAIFITRINPILSNDAISFVAGILKMNYWRFISATLTGIAPLTIFIAVLGRTTEGLKTGLIWGSVISLILFIAYVYWDKKSQKK
jgi:uncharacterized membrane protein YdjX (TVP38/TMEM64 family)